MLTVFSNTEPLNRDLSGGYGIGKIHYQDKPEFPLPAINNIRPRKQWNSESNLFKKWFNLRTDFTFYCYLILIFTAIQLLGNLVFSSLIIGQYSHVL